MGKYGAGDQDDSRASVEVLRALLFERLTRKYLRMLSPSVEASGPRQTLHGRVGWDLPGSIATRTTL